MVELIAGIVGGRALCKQVCSLHNGGGRPMHTDEAASISSNPAPDLAARLGCITPCSLYISSVRINKICKMISLIFIRSEQWGLRDGRAAGSAVLPCRLDV